MHFWNNVNAISNNCVRQSFCLVPTLIFPYGIGIHISFIDSVKSSCRTFSSFFRTSSVIKNERRVNCSLIGQSLKPIDESYKMSTLNNTRSTVFRLSDYDCIGFDLDNTLCEYNIYSAVVMEYEVLANILVKEKGYDPYYLLKPLDKSSLDFLQKGLLVDFARGNLLKLSEDGTICRASHGTKFLTNEEIIDAYGKSKRWDVTDEFYKNMLVAWNGPLSERLRALLDYFDMPASLAFARIIDSLDYKLGRPADVYNVWPDVLSGLHTMYKREHFVENKGGYFTQIKSNPLKYIKKCSPSVLEWLKQIHESKTTFLITGSNCDFASLTAETCLGKNWTSLFDIIVCYARKPGFFTGCRPFIELHQFKERDPVDGNDLKEGHIYSQGNWQDLYQFLERKVGKKDPKCLYIGDNLIQDVLTPSEYTKCDALAIVEELSIENVGKSYGDCETHPSEEILSSQAWGSYFFDEKENLNTLWNKVISDHSKMCIPSLEVLSRCPVDHEFTNLCKGAKNVYFPFTPTTLLEKSIGAV